MAQEQKIRAKKLKKMKIHKIKEKDDAILLELSSGENASQFYAISRAELGKMAALINKHATQPASNGAPAKAKPN